MCLSRNSLETSARSLAPPHQSLPRRGRDRKATKDDEHRDCEDSQEESRRAEVTMANLMAFRTW